MESLSEFAMIDHYFKPLSRIKNHFSDQLQQVYSEFIGDDGAVLNYPPGHQLILAADTLISGVHFPENLSPEAIGYRSLATNISDLAAMGARPAWYTLCISLPKNHTDWLKAFSEGLARAAREYHITLVGGDTTRSPILTISMQLIGFVQQGRALTRHQAKAGDLIYLTDSLGSAATGLAILQDQQADLLNDAPEVQREMIRAFCYPHIHSEFAVDLQEIASSAIDVSDGFSADLQHLAQASGLQARVYIEYLPIHPVIRAKLGEDAAIHMALSAGDDYSLCFTLAPSKQDALIQLAEKHQVKLAYLGEMLPASTLAEPMVEFWSIKTNKKLDYVIKGYQHF